MNWKDLLSTKKLTERDPAPGEWDFYPINPFEQDYNRIVSSAAFRRLQDKTQVFPLSKSDFVRTRLTHSIEVSTIAYQLGEMLVHSKSEYRIENIQKAREEMAQAECQDIPSVLRCAGLIHDLGNPPFGHFGEETIGTWFQKNLDKVEYKGMSLRKRLEGDEPGGDALGRRMIADLEHFEGNAQALRLLCKARYAGDIDVSYAVISSLVKYPTDSVASVDFKEKKLDKNRDTDDIKLHKPGVYLAEKDAFDKVSEAVGTKLADGTYCRHPLTYLMEASDDIAYATSDLEDAHKKKLFTLDEFIRYYRLALDSMDRSRYAKTDQQYKKAADLLAKLDAARESGESSDAAVFSEWLVYVRRWLMYVVAFKFSANYEAIMGGSFRQDMFQGEFLEFTLDILKGAMREFVYDREDLAPTELSGRTILSFLLDGFVKAALYWDERYQKEPELDEDGKEKVKKYLPSQEDNKYLGLLSAAYKRDYKLSRTGDERYDLYLRLLMVTDHISSMTDAYARDLFRRLRGME